MSRLGRRSAAAVLAVAAVTMAPVAVSHGQASIGAVQKQLGATGSKQKSLQQGVTRDNQQIEGFEGRAADLQTRLTGLQTALDTQTALLSSLQTRLRSARAKAVRLRVQLARDRRLLADQLVSSYEDTPPSLIDVIVNARSFSELLEESDRERTIQDANVRTATRVRDGRIEVRHQAIELTKLEGQQARVTRAVLVERDQVYELRIALLGRAATVRRARAGRQAQLSTIAAQRATLEKKLDRIRAQEAGPVASVAGVDVSDLPVPSGDPFAAHGGDYGFFQAPGTNYSVGSEPVLAGKLDAMGKALHLHLIGLSGYRTPEHSVEVGGFADDPHTKGQASDTPGVEGVPEATLNHFGLTRPFGGAAEADHIQLLGSI